MPLPLQGGNSGHNALMCLTVKCEYIAACLYSFGMYIQLSLEVTLPAFY